LQHRAAGHVHVKEVNLAVHGDALTSVIHDDVAVVSACRAALA